MTYLIWTGSEVPILTKCFCTFLGAFPSSRQLIYLLCKTFVAAIMSLTFQVRDQKYEETKYSIGGQTVINFKFKPRPVYRILVTIPASWRNVCYMNKLSSKSINYFKITIKRMLPCPPNGLLIYTNWELLEPPRDVWETNGKPWDLSDATLKFQ